MKYSLVIVVNFILCATLVGLIEWFDKEKESIASINKEHSKQMSRLQKIPMINEKIEDVIQKVKAQPHDLQDGALKIVKFYDGNHDDYDMIVKNYLYSDDNSENIDFSFRLNRDNKELIEKFINMNYEEGFLRFSELSMDQKDIIGVVRITQPHNGKKDADTSK